ncbi:angiotensin-converting enzyme-like [Leguminivora glycinivorella]|uniref:angiotensin-converting enzyme-like n=1 Tax=Leguminivora glycinivorella TaxID=1035111 RepID=UPI002010BC47|nr:angiotensin-converting enzyme-like [Leguminivora glycinivorella]
MAGVEKLICLLFLVTVKGDPDPQLDLPPIPQVSTQRNFGYGLLSSTPNNFQYSTPRPVSSTPGVYPVSSTPYNTGISPDINNNGYPNVDYGNRRNPSSTGRPYDNDDRIDVNNDPNFRRNDPNFARNDPNYLGVNPYDIRGNGIDDRLERVNIQQVREFLAQADEQASKECTNNVAAQWNFETEVTDATQHAALDAQQRYTLFQRGLWETAQQIPKGGIRDFPTYRQLRLLSIIGPAALPPDQLDRYNRLINDMLAVYNNAEICAYNEPFKCGLHLQPELQHIMSHSRDWDELQHVWTEWRRNTGRRIRDLYEQLVELTNHAAKLNNFTDASAYWMFPYESQNMRQEVDEVWEQIKPLYEVLHAYVRRRLREAYGPERISRSAPIPAHILGDMWGQSWAGIVPFTLPYPGKNLLDISAEMNQQGYTPLTMFQLAEEFFVSMNMSAMPADFWPLSVIEQPPDRHIHCQPSAWDFCNRHDYRIKMCTHVDMKDLITAHHEMAHIQYFLAYRNQPKVFRDGANPGFHEAIGEAIALSVSSPRHLQTLGLVQRSVADTAHDTNYLFTQAMDKLAFLPFALSMDRWRWDVFTGDVRKEQYNCHWWRLREQYQGIKPPVLRSELDFDPGSKYHIPANIPYIRYFVSTVLQFQIHRALCERTGQFIPGDETRPLHKCDIYRNPEAGRILTRLMERGSSVPWTQVLQESIGESRLSGEALRDYFRPLEEWLRSENLRTGEYLGWSYDGDYCKFSIETAGLQVYGGFYNAASRHDLTHFAGLLLISFFTTVFIRW